MNVVIRKRIETFKGAIQKLVALLASKGCRIVFHGSMCATDGDIIYLPALDILENSKASTADIDKFINALYGFVVHEVGHVLFTDHAMWKRENDKAGAETKWMTNAVEDGFVERKMQKLWGGSDESLSNAIDFALAKSDEAKEAPFSFQVALVVAFWARGDQYKKAVESKVQPKVFKWVEKNLVAEIKEASDITSTAESLDLAKRIMAKIRKAEKKRQEKNQKQNKNSKNGGEGSKENGEEGEGGENGEEEEGGENGEEGEGESSKRGSKKSKEKEKKEKGPVETGEESGEEEVPEEGEGAGERAEDGEEEDVSPAPEGGSTKPNPDNTPGDVGQLISKNFDSMLKDADPGYAVYTTAGDYIGPLEAEEYQLREFSELESQVSQSCSGLKAALARVLLSRSASYQVRGLTKGKVDANRVWRAAVLNQQPPKIHTRKFHGDTLDVGILFAVNESGSMSRGVPFGEAYITRCRAAAMTLLLLGDVLEGLGITWGVFGHTTEGSHVGHSRYNAAPIEAQKKFARFGALRIEWVKGFTESWRPKRRLIAALHPQNNTYDAEVLRYSAKQLLNVRVARRIIFMFDDGHPEPNIDSHQPIHQRELIKAVREVTSGGVEVLGVGMGHSAIGNYYPRHVHITELNKLPEVLLKVLGEMLAQWKRAV